MARGTRQQQDELDCAPRTPLESRYSSRTVRDHRPHRQQPSPITSGVAFDERPAFSPDGQRIAFVSDRGGRRGIWIIEPNNPVPYRKLIDLPGGVFLRGLTWAADGTSFIVGRYRWAGDIFLAERSSST
jgi:Tol biopolymer transport system component